MTLEIFVVVCAWFAGGFISGVSGIGGAMFAVPIAAMFIPIQQVIVLSCILNLAMDGGLTLLHFRFCRFKALLPMLAGTIPGSVAGLFILQMVSGQILEGIVGVLLLVFLLWQQFFRIRKKGKESWQIGGLAGCVAGIFGTAISFDGPPVAAYGLYAGWQPRVFLGTLGVFFILRGIFACTLQAYSGLYSPDVIQYALYGFPATLLGTFCAFPVTKKVNPEIFNRILKIIIAIAAAACIYRACHNSF